MFDTGHIAARDVDCGRTLLFKQTQFLFEDMPDK
jgi:hypothetical protein